VDRGAVRPPPPAAVTGSRRHRGLTGPGAGEQPPPPPKGDGHRSDLDFGRVTRSASSEQGPHLRRLAYALATEPVTACPHCGGRILYRDTAIGFETRMPGPQLGRPETITWSGSLVHRCCQYPLTGIYWFFAAKLGSGLCSEQCFRPDTPGEPVRFRQVSAGRVD
jgi:hypothetical protein